MQALAISNNARARIIRRERVGRADMACLQGRGQGKGAIAALPGRAGKPSAWAKLRRMDENKQAPRSRTIYLLPNLFTTAGLFAGFYAIIAAANGQFVHASVAVFIA